MSEYPTRNEITSYQTRSKRKSNLIVEALAVFCWGTGGKKKKKEKEREKKNNRKPFRKLSRMKNFVSKLCHVKGGEKQERGKISTRILFEGWLTTWLISARATPMGRWKMYSFIVSPEQEWLTPPYDLNTDTVDNFFFFFQFVFIEHLHEQERKNFPFNSQWERILFSMNYNFVR